MSLIGTSRHRRTSVRHHEGAHWATRFLTQTLQKVATEMALSVLAYNLTRVINIVGLKPLIAAIATPAGSGFSPASLGKAFLHGQDPSWTSTSIVAAGAKSIFTTTEALD